MDHVKKFEDGGIIQHHSNFKSQVKHCELKVVVYKEDDEYIAECPLFYVSSHGSTEKMALTRVEEALKLYLSDEKVQKEMPETLDCSDEAILKKSEDLFYEYNDPDEELPEFVVKKIYICLH